MSKPLPKSIHTVSAIVNVARLIMANTTATQAAAVRDALEALGYSPENDPYGLAATALRQLEKAAK